MHLLTLIAVTSIALAASISVVRPHPAPPAASPAQLAPLARRDPSPRFPSRRRRHRPHRHRQPDDDSDDNQDDDGAAARVEAIVLPGFANISTAVDGSSANVSAFGQAFLFSPPAPEDDDVDVIDPYDGLFNVFRAFDLSPEQEQTLVNRSYYFKVGPYVAKQAQVQLMATQSPTANLTVPAVPDIQDPQPLPLDIAPPKPDADRPPESRAAITLGDENNENGAVLVNNTFTNLPKDFVPSEPVPEGLGSVLVPYQVAALRDGQQPVADPQGGGGSYLVMQPRAYGGQSGGGGGEGGQGARMQQDQVRHMAVLSDIDDVLKDTRVFSSTPSREALVNTYAEIYQPIPGMPELIRDTILGANSSTNPALTFHYISGSPLPLAPGLLQFFQAYYPPGSLTLRPVTSFDSDSISNFLSDGFTNEFRLQAHRDVLNTYPQAEAVVFGDTTETTVETYLDVLSEYPERVKCVYLRRLQGSGSSLTADQVVDKINDRVTEELRQRAREVVVVFDDPKELQGLDFAASPVKCR